MLYLTPCKPSLNGPNGNYIVLNGWKLTAAALRMHNVTLHECVPSRDSKESMWLHRISYTHLSEKVWRFGLGFHFTPNLLRSWCEAVIAYCLRTKGGYCGRKFDLVVPEQNHSSSGYMEFPPTTRERSWAPACKPKQRGFEAPPPHAPHLHCSAPFQGL